MLKPLPVNLQSKGRVGDEIDFLSIQHGVPAGTQNCQIMASCYFVIVRRLEACALDLPSGNILHRIGDSKPSIRGTILAPFFYNAR